MKKLLITIMVFVTIQSISAQQINNVFAFRTDHKQSIMLNLELDPALVWGITYNRSFDIRIGHFERRLNSQIGWKTFKFNYNDLNLNFNTTMGRREAKANVLINFGAENKYLENVVHQANVYSWIASMMPGYFGKKWYVGTELMYKWLHRVKYEHTDFYRAIFPEVRDGWYAYRNGYFNLSVNTGVRLSGTVDLDLRAGYRLSHDLKNYQPYIQPYFADLAVNFRF